MFIVFTAYFKYFHYGIPFLLNVVFLTRLCYDSFGYDAAGRGFRSRSSFKVKGERAPALTFLAVASNSSVTGAKDRKRGKETGKKPLDWHPCPPALVLAEKSPFWCGMLWGVFGQHLKSPWGGEINHLAEFRIPPPVLASSGISLIPLCWCLLGSSRRISNSSTLVLSYVAFIWAPGGRTVWPTSTQSRVPSCHRQCSQPHTCGGFFMGICSKLQGSRSSFANKPRKALSLKRNLRRTPLMLEGESTGQKIRTLDERWNSKPTFSQTNPLSKLLVFLPDPRAPFIT